MRPIVRRPEIVEAVEVVPRDDDSVSIEVKRYGVRNRAKVRDMRSLRRLEAWEAFCDFENVTIVAPFALIRSGAGSGATAAGLSVAGGERIGVLSFSTGTTTTGAGGWQTDLDCIRLGNGEAIIETDIYIPDLSAVAQEYDLRFGFLDSISGDPADGAYFEYDRNTSTSWNCKTANNSNRTTTGSGVVVVEDDWIRLKVVVAARGERATFYINDRLVASHATNIPTAAGRETGAGCVILKSAGTTARTVLGDWCWARINRRKNLLKPVA